MCFSGKEPFATAHKARRALRQGLSRAKYAYRCSCGAWHVTKMARSERDGVVARQSRRARRELEDA